MKEKKHQTTPRFKCIGMLLTLALILIGQVAQAQSKQVTGVVKDATGETVIGASVLEKVHQAMVRLPIWTVTSS